MDTADVFLGSGLILIALFRDFGDTRGMGAADARLLYIAMMIERRIEASVVAWHGNHAPPAGPRRTGSDGSVCLVGDGRPRLENR